MPAHDWTRPPPGLFHHFHRQWSGEICDGLNGGILPSGYFALIEQRTIGREPDVLALGTGPGRRPGSGPAGGIVATAQPPQARFAARLSERESYARRANRIGVRDSFGKLVAAIELVSPGNKDGRRAIEAFVEETTEFLAREVNLLVVDLFPPTARDPQGFHKAIRDRVQDENFELPADKPLTLAAYRAEPTVTAYVEPLAVGDLLSAMPLFLEPDDYVLAPLEETYVQTWNKCPAEMRALVGSGGANDTPA